MTGGGKGRVVYIVPRFIVSARGWLIAGNDALKWVVRTMPDFANRDANWLPSSCSWIFVRG